MEGNCEINNKQRRKQGKGKQEKCKIEDSLGDGQAQKSKEHVVAAAVGEQRLGCERPIADLAQEDYLRLLNCLKIKLPEDIVTQQVIKLTNHENIIQDARVILGELENFLIRFKAIPRLACHEVKHYLDLKETKKVLEITKLLFFEKEDQKEKREQQWTGNRSNTGHGFRLRKEYCATTISTPAMYSTATTRSRCQVKVGEDSPIVTEGTRVLLSDIEGKDYSDESELWKNGKLCGPGNFGMFFQNKEDMPEMLKFFHELGELKKPVNYSKGNKVEYGFLTGNLDFLAVEQKAGKKSKRFVIECKGTTGDMVGKAFTKKPKSCHAKITQNHEYSFQVQAYMYILNEEAQVKKFPQMKKGVMVFRHYNEGGTPPRDFWWNYLVIDSSIQEQLGQLRLLCQGEVLARYLALLNLIFQKETVSS